MHRVTFLKSSSLIHVQWFSSGDIGFIVLLYCYFWQHNIRVRAFHKLSLSLFAFLLLSPLSFAVLKDVMLGAFALTESCRCCCFMFFLCLCHSANVHLESCRLFQECLSCTDSSRPARGFEHGT